MQQASTPLPSFLLSLAHSCHGCRLLHCSLHHTTLIYASTFANHVFFHAQATTLLTLAEACSCVVLVTNQVIFIISIFNILAQPNSCH